MKRIVFCISFLVVFALTSISTYAQITVDERSSNMEIIPITLKPGDSSAIRLIKYTFTMEDGTQISSYGLAAHSSNRFDNYFRLDLGKNKNECIQSLESLLNLLETMNRGDMKVINSENDRINVTLGKFLGVTYLVISSNGYAGTANIEYISLTRCLEYFEELKE